MSETLHEGFDGLVQVLNQVPQGDILIVNIGAYDAARSFRNMFSNGSYADGRDATGVTFIEIEASRDQAKQMVGISGDGVTVVAADAGQLSTALSDAHRTANIITLANVFSGGSVAGSAVMDCGVLRSYFSTLAQGGELLVFEYNEPALARERLKEFFAEIQVGNQPSEGISAVVIEPTHDDFTPLQHELGRVGMNDREQGFFKTEWEHAKKHPSVGMPFVLRIQKK